MGTHLLNVTGRIKIIHAKSGNTEVKIIGENSEGGVKYSIELKLSELLYAFIEIISNNYKVMLIKIPK